MINTNNKTKNYNSLYFLLYSGKNINIYKVEGNYVFDIENINDMSMLCDKNLFVLACNYIDKLSENQMYELTNTVNKEYIKNIKNSFNTNDMNLIRSVEDWFVNYSNSIDIHYNILDNCFTIEQKKLNLTKYMTIDIVFGIDNLKIDFKKEIQKKGNNLTSEFHDIVSKIITRDNTSEVITQQQLPKMLVAARIAIIDSINIIKTSEKEEDKLFLEKLVLMLKDINDYMGKDY